MEQAEHERYDPTAVEERWQAVWAAEETFTVPNPDPAPVAPHLGHRSRVRRHRFSSR